LRWHRGAAIWSAVVALALCPTLATPETEAGLRFFREKIEPVLKRECYECHSVDAKKVKADLRLDSRAGLLTGGESGPALKPGDMRSLLLQALRHEGGLEMPSEKPKLPPQIIADFEQWVALGAPHTEEGEIRAANPATDPRQARGYWAFQPVKAPAIPRVKDERWAANSIDRFVLAKLEAQQLVPAQPAAKSDLVRRVYFDVTGLPPSPDEVEAFVNDRAPDAYERLVDRLLASPHYGEHFARGWLDVVRFAESEGFEYDRPLPDAWRFRDYVIDSFNRDKPFDRFVTEQLAGDEIAAGNRELETAAVFHRLGAVRRNAGNQDVAASRNEVLIERTDIIGSAILGLTVGCARCHDHKFDPILQKDYYRLQAYLASTQEHDILLVSDEEKQAWDAQTKVVTEKLRRLRRVSMTVVGAEKAKIEEEIEALEYDLPPPPATIPGIKNDPAQRTPIHVLKRGDWDRKGDPVAPRPPTVLVSDDLPELPADTATPRTELARWIADAKNPLTPRVAVNRIWQHHFGTGLVKTSNDFGQNGERPSHPELLDWLANQFVAGGWKLKPLHRLILLSSTYRQGSRSELTTAAHRVDPDNRLLWHFARRRLSAEEIRDAMLAVSGKLNLKMSGPSVMVPVDPDLVKFLYKPSQWAVTSDRSEHHRRSVYLIAKRNLRLPFMETFDQPDLLSSCARRESSTHAPQALEMMNGQLANEVAAAFAERLAREAGPDHRRIVERAFVLALGRPPNAEERKFSLSFLEPNSLREFALAVLNLNAFFYAP
jgi:hypothetical protein